MKNMDKNIAFFKPMVGNDYSSGFHGVKTLVVGASLPCTHTDCAFRSKCMKDSSTCDLLCPHSRKENGQPIPLSDSPATELDTYCNDNDTHDFPAYDNFTKLLSYKNEYITNGQRNEIWEKVAFTEYLQNFLPHWETPAYSANRALFDKYFPAFLSVLERLEPQLVIIWGKPVREAIEANMLHCGYITKEDMDEKNYNHKVNIGGKEFIFCYVDHPSSSSFKSCWEEHRLFLEKAIELYKKHIV